MNLDQPPDALQRDLLFRLRQEANSARLNGDNHSASHIEAQIDFIEQSIRFERYLRSLYIPQRRPDA